MAEMAQAAAAALTPEAAEQGQRAMTVEMETVPVVTKAAAVVVVVLLEEMLMAQMQAMEALA
jgi:hypothetical protein